MTLCRFYQQGYCKFGSSCRFEHPNAAANNQNQGTNRFGALGATNGSSGGPPDPLEKYHVSADVIEKDLTLDAPQWILSAYAPGRDTPEQLFGGYPREQSFEELRLHYWTGKATGNEQQALNEAQQLWQNAKQQMENAARNPGEAARFIVEGENRHPNRHDVCKEGTQGAPFDEFLVGKRSALANPFGESAAPAANAFGQPSALGQQANPFGQPSQTNSAFGQPSQPSSTFGQPAQIQNASAFGQPSQGQPAFGQPSQPTSAFGQPSALGAKPNPFGAPAFGQASQPGSQSSPFGQSQPPAQGSAFGQPSQLGQKPNPFAAAAGPGASPFAAAASNTATASPFASAASGQANSAPSPFAAAANQNNAAPNAFAQAAQQQQQNPFGQPAQQQQQQQQPAPPQQQNPFGQPSPQGNPFASSNQGPTPAAGNPFAQQQQQQPPQQQQQSPFGGQTNGANTFGQTNANPFGQQPATNGTSTGGNAGGDTSPYPPNSNRQHPPISSYSSKDMTGRLSMFKGKPVTYKDGMPGIRTFDGTWTKIWFPDGPPGYNKDTALSPEQYGDKTKAQWLQFAQTGAFADGIMPELPPPRECTQWDF
ncbi:Nuclear pore protein AMO1 [Cladobotryum mycophilum]|uniref:Nuclear pore protein AMO1 n=1 Tax=Cladobotryum mycophilum TaxID=491253 RepID=A0ABR0STX1_9HYPO